MQVVAKTCKSFLVRGPWLGTGAVGLCCSSPEQHCTRWHERKQILSGGLCVVHKMTHQVQCMCTQTFLSHGITRNLLIAQQISSVSFREAWNCSNKGSTLWCVSQRLDTVHTLAAKSEKITAKAEEKQSTPYCKFTAKKATGMLNSHFAGHLVPRQAVICDNQVLWTGHLFHSCWSFSHPSSLPYFTVCILSQNRDNKPFWAKNIVWSLL